MYGQMDILPRAAVFVFPLDYLIGHSLNVIGCSRTLFDCIFLVHAAAVFLVHFEYNYCHVV